MDGWSFRGRRLPQRAELRRLGQRWAAALALIALLTLLLVPLRDDLSSLNAGLLYLLLVVMLAARWGWGPGLLASVVANLVFNFFFVPPRYQFGVASAGNLLELAVFLAATALTAALLGRARAGEAAARRREQETAVLYDLSRLSILEPDTTRTLGAVCRRAVEAFEVDGCVVLVPVEGRLTPVAAAGEQPAWPASAYERRAAEEALASGEIVFLGGPGHRRPRIVGLPDRPAPVANVPLRVGGATVGVLCVTGNLRARVFTADALRLLEAFADIAALTVERERLLREAAGIETLKETDRLKSALLSAVSHDLRTPLAAIKSSVSALIEPGVSFDEATRRELLTAVDEETDRLTRLVTHLLDLSRIEGGALRPEIDTYDVRELVETVAARLARTTARHRLTLEIAPDTGEAAFDYVQIGQVLTNLVENAVKYAPEGSEIRIGARRLADAVELSVSDAGPGIPLEARAAVFEKFYRVPRGRGSGSGAGLGLAISKGLVEAHGGTIRAEAAPGGGARIVFTLPLRPVAGARSNELTDAARAVAR